MRSLFCRAAKAKGPSLLRAAIDLAGAFWICHHCRLFCQMPALSGWLPLATTSKLHLHGATPRRIICNGLEAHALCCACRTSL